MKTKEGRTKAYATTSSGKWCDLRYDYSFMSYGRCHECLFCYKYIPDGILKVKKFSKAIASEQYFNENLFKIPITVSRFEDPFGNPISTYNTIGFSKFILENGGMISFVSPNSRIPEKAFSLMEQYKDNVQYQVVVFSDDSFSGKSCRSVFAPKWCDIYKHADNIKRMQDIGIKVIIKIDPIIIGINDFLIQGIIDYFKSLGCYNYILRQVYATDFLKEKISVISRRTALMLSEQSGKYYTYPGEILLDCVSGILLNNADCTITFCQNSWMNKILKSHKNCCQFDNSEYKFNNDWANVTKINKPNENINRLIKA